MSGVLVGSTVIGAIGSNIAANKASNASKSAANAQINAEEQARQEQLLAYQQSAPGLAQFMMPHQAATFAPSWGGTGNETMGPQPANGTVPQGGQIPGQQSQQSYDPLNQLRASAGVMGPEAQQQFYDNFVEDPGTQWLREQGQHNINQSSSATGGLGGGSRLKAISEFNQGIANQSLGSRLSQLGSLAETDIGLAGSLANMRTGLGSANAVSLQNIGQTQAQNAYNQGQIASNNIGAITSGIGTGLGAYMNRPTTASATVPYSGTAQQSPNQFQSWTPGS